MIEVLLVEPDEPTSRVLTQFLRSEGYVPSSVGSATEARAILDEWRPAAVVLELSLPDQDGLILIPWIATHSPASAILVATERARKADIVVALKLGADDYITKPFDAFEFEVRLARVIARTNTKTIGVGATGGADVLRIGELTINKVRGTIRVAETTIHATPTEFRLVLILAAHVGEVVTRTSMAEAVWGVGAGEFGTSHLVDVHVGRFRNKLRAAGAGKLIETIRRTGFRMVLPRGTDDDLHGR